MKHTIDLQHRDYFLTHQTIEFDDLLSSKQVHELRGIVRNELAQRLKEPAQRFIEIPTDELFMHGRDLWRDQETIKKYEMHTHLAQIACELLQLQSIRMGFDQAILPGSNPPASFFNGTFPLKNKSCIRGLQCGLMLALTDHPSNTASSEGVLQDIFPYKAGHGTYFSANKELDFSKISEHIEQEYLLVVYTHPVSVYAICDEDPYTHVFKKIGYCVGDKFSEKTLPLVYKR